MSHEEAIMKHQRTQNCDDLQLKMTTIILTEGLQIDAVKKDTNGIQRDVHQRITIEMNLEEREASMMNQDLVTAMKKFKMAKHLPLFKI
jgi:hypothetical protein